MTLDAAIRWCEIGLACALAQQSVEHLAGAWTQARANAANARSVMGSALVAGPMFQPDLNAPRLLLSIALLFGVAPALVLALTTGLAIVALTRVDGPYNGGSDRLGVLTLLVLLVCRVWPAGAPVAMGYLAVQVVASYALAGWAKIVNPDWRSGRALRDLFAFTIYPASDSLRAVQHYPRLLCVLAWGVMLIEMSFPLALADRRWLIVALTLTGIFHVIAALILGLNRFVWVWIATYPALMWFQSVLVR